MYHHSMNPYTYRGTTTASTTPNQYVWFGLSAVSVSSFHRQHVPVINKHNVDELLALVKLCILRIRTHINLYANSCLFSRIHVRRCRTTANEHTGFTLWYAQSNRACCVSSKFNKMCIPFVVFRKHEERQLLACSSVLVAVNCSTCLPIICSATFHFVLVAYP